MNQGMICLIVGQQAFEESQYSAPLDVCSGQSAEGGCTRGDHDSLPW